MDEDGLDALQVPFACSRLQGENQKDMSFRGKTLSSHLVRALHVYMYLYVHPACLVPNIHDKPYGQQTLVVVWIFHTHT